MGKHAAAFKFETDWWTGQESAQPDEILKSPRVKSDLDRLERSQTQGKKPDSKPKNPVRKG